MLLAVDVGNTNIVFGVLKGKNIVGSFRMMSQTAHTSDEYGNNIIAMLRNNGIDKDEINGIIISSVVPNVMYALVNSMIKYLGKKPYIVGPGIKTGIRILTKNPNEVGPDLVVGAVAAHEIYGGPAIVIDFGTATTYVLINENGDFVAGVVSPGIRISAKALWEDTAKLPEIEIRKPESILAQETISSMQAGLVYGQIGQTKYIINEMKRESGFKDVKVIATGGLGRLISDECDEIDIYDNNLLIQGLRIIYDKNKRIKPKNDEFENTEH
ncbi:type III pantothenate kinase [Butyrivibrio sp. WCE2006]|uniref:type III pantothenate kinase n=1 Tax=Butyrivibrio sp. WCE2006 TaxID=1410611 RepID=UPI0005D1504C|nr:type III pantothenate kinase [Butyrivibrio sp. WCE2006]